MPITLILYKVCPPKFRNMTLLFFSLVFYGWGEPLYLFLMVGSILINYIGGLVIEKYESSHRAKKVSLIVAIALNLGILSFFKYSDFMIENLNGLFDLGLGALRIALPIGISFYTFQAMSYVIDVYRQEVKAQHNFINFAMYVSMFPQLIAGPIVRYKDIEGSIDNRKIDYVQVYEGTRRFVVGLGKKVLLANQAGMLWEEIYSYGGQTDAPVAWLGALLFTFQIYFDFSGYSDMAIGLGKILGFEFPENFNYPYTARSITDFWTRWHMTLSGWFKSYLYIPLGGNRKGLGRQILNLFIVWSLTGLWHGASWNFVLWGVYFFVILVLEKVFLLKLLDKLPVAFGHIYTILLVIISWVIFACDDMTILPKYFGSMFGVGTNTGMFPYYLLGCLVLLIVMAIGSTKLPKRCMEGLKTGFEKRLGKDKFVIVEILLMIITIALCLMLLVGDSYNPFLYFRF